MDLKRFFPFGLLLLLSGCISHEDDFISKYCPGSCTVIQGRLTTANGTEPLRGVQLTAIWKDLHYLGGGTIRKKAVARTDANGNYELSFLLRDQELLEGHLVIQPALDQQTYATCNADIYLGAPELRRDTTIRLNYNAPRKATLLLTLANRQDIKPGDHFSTTFSFQAGAGEELCSPGVEWSWTTAPPPALEVAAEQPVLVRSHKIKSGVETTETDTLLLSAGQQLTYKAEF